MAIEPQRQGRRWGFLLDDAVLFSGAFPV